MYDIFHINNILYKVLRIKMITFKLTCLRMYRRESKVMVVQQFVVHLPLTLWRHLVYRKENGTILTF